MVSLASRYSKSRIGVLTVQRNAGGRTSELTSELVKACQKLIGIETCMHLTCTGMPKEKVDTALRVSRSQTISCCFPSVSVCRLLSHNVSRMPCCRACYECYSGLFTSCLQSLSPRRCATPLMVLKIQHLVLLERLLRFSILSCAAFEILQTSQD